MRRNVLRLVYLVTICSVLVSCGLLQKNNSTKFNFHAPADRLTDTSAIKEALYSQFNDWQGVRYQRGGLSQHGIDCSGFVYLTFKSRLGLDLPRTTWMQAKLGKEIKKSDLRSGDLVFFKTGITSSHVGIYLEKNKFLHASEKKGVTISKLDHAYWKFNYWKSVRI